LGDGARGEALRPLRELDPETEPPDEEVLVLGEDPERREDPEGTFLGAAGGDRELARERERVPRGGARRSVDGDLLEEPEEPRLLLVPRRGEGGAPRESLPRGADESLSLFGPP